MDKQKEGINFQSNEAQILYQSGLIFEDSWEMNIALACFRKAQSFPNAIKDLNAHILYSDFYSKEPDDIWEDLFEWVQKVSGQIRITPDVSLLYNLRAYIIFYILQDEHNYQDQGWYNYQIFSKRLIADATMCITLNPMKCEFWDMRASFYELLGESQRALADYNRSIEIDPEYRSLTYSYRAKLLLEQGKILEALTDVQKAKSLAENDGLLRIYAVKEKQILQTLTQPTQLNLLNKIKL